MKGGRGEALLAEPDKGAPLDEKCAWMRARQAKKTRERVPRGKYSRMMRLVGRVRKVEADDERQLVAEAERGTVRHA